MKFFKDVKNNLPLLALATPCIAWLIAFCYVPMFGIIIAFKDFRFNKGTFGSNWVGFKDFEFLFTTDDAWIMTRNTVLYNLAFIAIGLIFSISFAILYDALGSSKLNRINQTVAIFPHFLSWVVITFFGYAILSSDKGIANQIITKFGGEPINWYSEPKYWPFILPIVSIWKGVGYSSIIYYSNIRGFDSELYEAARIDGATWVQSVFHITLPLLKPIVTIMFIMSVGGIMHSDFGMFQLFPKNSGALYSVTQTIDTYVYNGMMGGSGNMGVTGAVGFYQAIVGFLMVIGANAVVKKIEPDNALF